MSRTCVRLEKRKDEAGRDGRCSAGADPGLLSLLNERVLRFWREPDKDERLWRADVCGGTAAVVVVAAFRRAVVPSF